LEGSEQEFMRSRKREVGLFDSQGGEKLQGVILIIHFTAIIGLFVMSNVRAAEICV
jgi:hypothetical protein